MLNIYKERKKEKSGGGDKYSLENASVSKFSQIQEEDHKLRAFIPRKMDKYLLTIFYNFYYNLYQS